MITSFFIKNFGPFNEFSFDTKENNINSIDIETGKTFLLKFIYASIKSIESNMRGNNNQKLVDSLSEKLRWTFQVDTLNELIHKPFCGDALCILRSQEETLSFSLGKAAKKKVKLLEGDNWKRPENNSVFIPAGNIFTWQNAILRTRERDNIFGFDNTYFDLAKALYYPKKKENEICLEIYKIIKGKMEFDSASNKWFFHQNEVRIPAELTSTMVQQLSALDILLENTYLSCGSILLVDGWDHQEMMDIFPVLAENNIQIFSSIQNNIQLKEGDIENEQRHPHF